MKKFLMGVLITLIFISTLTFAGNYSQELQDAYQFAYQNKITTINSIDKADMNGGLTRIAMAKMLSQYAINILGKTPDTSKSVNFSDVSYSLDNDYNNGVTLAYQLGIMGIGIDKFRPFDSVTRAEFGTALSRVLYGNKYEGGNPYYINHLNILKTSGIMTKIDHPQQGEVRGYVMLMLMRSKGNGSNLINNDTINYTDTNKDTEEMQINSVNNPIFTDIDDGSCYLNVHYSDGTSLKSKNCSDKYRVVIHNYGSKTGFENYCLVEFRDYDGTILKNDEIRGEGTEFSEIEKPKTPTRPSDKNCTYTFSGWSNAFTISGKYNDTSLSKISDSRLKLLASDGSLLLNCQHRAEYICTPTVSEVYTVTWKDADGSILQQNKNLNYGDAMPLYEGKDPEKKNYVFIGWQLQNGENGTRYTVQGNRVYSAIFSDKGVEVPGVAKYAGRGCSKYTSSVRENLSQEYSGTIFLNLPREVIKDGWYFIGCNDTDISNNSNVDQENVIDTSNEDSSLNNSSNNNSLNDDSSSDSNSSPSNDTLTSDDKGSNDDILNDEVDSSENSTNLSNNSDNCVNIDVDDGNVFCFDITKYGETNYGMSINNSDELSTCSIGKGGQTRDFPKCEGQFTVLGASGKSSLRLAIKYNNKSYNKTATYDFSNGVFVN